VYSENSLSEPHSQSPDTLYLSDVVSALSTALDLAEGQPMGHAIRSCILGMRIAQELELPVRDRSDLYYALLLKDAGCSANSARLHHILGSDDRKAKREAKYEDWTRLSYSGFKYLLRNVLPQASAAERIMRIAKLGVDLNQNKLDIITARCDRGAEIARKVGLSSAAVSSISSLDELWNGHGFPRGLRGEQIPLLARIMNLSQTLEVFASLSGPRIAMKVISNRSASWFDPSMVHVIQRLEHDDALWRAVSAPDARKYVLQIEPGVPIEATENAVENLCLAFSQVIDAKSPYTFQHSTKVAQMASAIAKKLGMAPAMITMTRRAGLLRDIGKLSISNSILEKPGELTVLEWDAVRMSPIYTRLILANITGMADLAFCAGAYNERLDGSGYPDGLTELEIPLSSRVIAVADTFQAMREKRPYREPWSAETVLDMMRCLIPHKLDCDCFEALREYVFENPGSALAHAAGV
jgi:HD-GYP domain-containing protein (c-di-GMP phosphodiesterase class II)